MTVTAAAELLNIGRPALSRVLNGKAALSPRLAERIQQAFGFPTEKLLKMQASYNAGISKNSGASSPVGSYVPPFLQIRARQIEEWASGIQARSRLSVLLRILVNSTGIGLEKVDFPGNDDAERQGWDGAVEAERTTPWIPQGLSGWEFGCSRDIKSKADKDFGARTRSVPESERRAATFVFVTPRRWTGKNDWEETRREEHQWKNVRVFDASDLEQWIEQSIPAQIWFAHETGIPSKGVFSLEQCWKHWQADCEPSLVPSLFDQALMESKNRVERWLVAPQDEPLKIAADSTAEALAYLHVVFSEEEPLFQEKKDKVAVFKQPGILPDLLSAESGLIVVSTSPETECELAPYRKSLKVILVYSQNMANVNPDITLKPLNCFALDASLKEMGFNRGDDADRYRRECGYSLTVLRRRLSKLPKVRTPEWASTEHAEKLIPMVFAGAWNSNNETDNFLVSKLVDGMDVESEIRRLSQLEDSPVWSFDAYRGIKSKIDALFAVSEFVTASHIERFLQVAEIVLSEDDPALDLPEDQQWLAALHGKSREISDMLRTSAISSLALLAVHGNGLFQKRTGFDIEAKIRQMIRKLLSPLNERVLEAQSDALPAYAEAAPDTFLSIIEQDIENGSQEVTKLFRPVDASLFKSPPRVEILWALESLAWSGDYLVRTVDILARLARVESDDSYLNKAINSLAAIFWPAAPQTSVPISELTKVFNCLLEKFSDIGWILCMKQLEQGSSISPTHKPKWRTDGHGHGQPVSEHDCRKFVRNAARKAIDWNPHTEETLADLIQSLDPHSKIPFEWWPEVWKLVENWHEDRETSDADRAWLREVMSVSVDFKASPEAERAYSMLEPSDCVLKYEWLFRSHAVVCSRTEIVDPDFDIHKYGAKIELQRISALSEIYSEHGLSGLIRLAGSGEGQHAIGNLVLRVDSFSGDEAKSLIRHALDEMTEENRTQMATLIRSLLMGLEPVSLDRMLEKFSEGSSEETFLKILLLAPFDPGTWRLANKLDKGKWYWKEVEVQHVTDPVQLNEAVERLMEAERPLSAASLAQYQIHKIETGRIFRLLESIVKGVNKSGESCRLNPMFIEKAFAQLDRRTDIPRNKIADMEVVYIDFLKHSKRGIPCVEDRIKKHPQFFAEIVFTAYNLKKDSSIQDDILKKKIWGYLDLLSSLKQLPGRDESGELKPENLVKWIRDAQAVFRRSDQLATGDYCIGELLSKSPDGKDGIWPCEPVRDALEEVYSEKISSGFRIGRSNSHDGTHVGFGGDPERKTERRYREWAERIKYSHPKTSEILRELAENSSAMANYQDKKAEKLFRQMSF